jgi:serine/threonine protein kinase
LLYNREMNPSAGQIVGSFVLRNKIADGGMASVWAAEHVTLKREVAVKFLATSAHDEVAIERFALEARTIARVASAHVPQVFDHGVTEDGTPYIVMELLAGTDLRSWVAESGCLEVAQAVRLVEQVCLALGAAHEIGVVHRDVKPENIILSGPSGSFDVKLIDFGIAKSLGHLRNAPAITQAGMTIGTPSYMSPEQLTSVSDVDERSDVWSLAVVAYWALTGKLPFDGETFAAVCLAITRGHFTPPSELRSGLPLTLDGWFEKALSRDISERFQSVDVMSRMLKVAAADPAGWTRALPLVTAVARPKSESDSDLAIVGLSHSSGPSAAARPWRRRARAIYAAGGALLGLVVVTSLSLLPPRTTGARTDVPSLPSAVALGETTLPAPVPVALAIPSATSTTVAPESSPERISNLPGDSRSEPPLLRREVAVTVRPIEPRGRVHTKPAVRLAAIPNAPPIRATLVPADTGPVAPPDPSAWHPSDDLGEP